MNPRRAAGFSNQPAARRCAQLLCAAAGSSARNPSELLSSEKLARLFRDPALAGFDRIILDTPPINAVSDALPLVKFATSTCLVVRAGSTPAKAAKATPQP